MSRQDSNQENQNNNKLSKTYYWIIGILFVILIGLVIFIFTRSGNDVDLGDDDNASSIVQDGNNGEEDQNSDESDGEEDSAVDDTDEENPSDETDDSSSEEENDNDENEAETDAPDPGETTTVNENAPHDPDHPIDYSEGSDDRIAIKNEIMRATGLGNDLIEWWVGNNGPGRVEATISNPDQSIVYRVYLQYGDGNWFVTSFERLSELP